MNFKQGVLFSLLWFATTSVAFSQVLSKKWSKVVTQQPEEWFATDEAKRIADNVLLYQRDVGGWPKNKAVHKVLSETDKIKLLELKKTGKGATIDNGATSLELVYLLKVYPFFPEEKYKNAFQKGIDYIVESQYESGGWPQFYPLKKGYYTHITYNDDATVNIMRLLQKIASGDKAITIPLPKETVAKAKEAFDKGIDCIVKTQYKQNGVLTAWCAQHDEKTFAPAKARAYELPSLSGSESAEIVKLLMSIENPSPEVINAVESAVDWFEKTKITGFEEKRHYNKKGRIVEKEIVANPNAKPMWARFMELEDNTPFFCGRDGVKKSDYQQIEKERRVGYAWYRTEPNKVLKQYPIWKKRIEKYTIITLPTKRFTVDPSGKGDYKGIQEAIDATKAFPYYRVELFIKKGVYKEKVHVYEWNTYLSLIGEDEEKTVIKYGDFFNKINLGRNSTFHTPTVQIDADYAVVKNLTIENSAGDVGQAIALSINADKVLVEKCKILGNQDTFYATGNGKRVSVKSCYIDGTTDFIFGRATVLFEKCEIRSKKDSYITAASTEPCAKFGFVFKHCKLTADKGVQKVYLGRPWRYYAQTVFIDCEMGKHILPEGWHNWKKPEAEKRCLYAEYKSTGEGAAPEKRVKWSRQFDSGEAKQYAKKKILGADEWWKSKK